MFERWKEWIDRHFGESQHKKWKYMLVIAAAGLIFIIMSNFFSGSQPDLAETEDPDAPAEDEPIQEVSLEEDVADVEATYQQDLEAMLNQIKGVSETEVMINLDATNEQVYEKDRTNNSQTQDETDKNGGERDMEDEQEETELVHVRSGDEEIPVLVQTKKPEVRGVFVTAQGAEHKEVEKWIIESVSKVLDVPTHKISVMPK